MRNALAKEMGKIWVHRRKNCAYIISFFIIE